jgi:hypothetical protein
VRFMRFRVFSVLFVVLLALALIVAAGEGKQAATTQVLTTTSQATGR